METTLPFIQKNPKQVAEYLSSAIMFIWGVVFLLYPLLLIPALTDPFILPKQLLIGVAALVSLLLWGARIVILGKVTIRRTAFDMPLLLVMLAFLLSALFAVERYDALINTVPVLFAVIGFFTIINSTKKESGVLFLLGSAVLSTVILSLWALFSFLKVYPLSIPETHLQSFSPLGSLLEQMVVMAIVFPLSLVMGFPILKGKTEPKAVAFAAATVLIAAGGIVTLVQLMFSNQLVILPWETGFQTAFAAISQDTGRIAQGFLFGSGYGNFGSIFTRFKQASFNSNPLWAAPFNHSSSFLLEILGTTGILGFLAFLFLLFRVVVKPTKKIANPLYLSLVVGVILALILPFSVIELMLFVLLLALYVTTDALKHPQKYFDVELRFVTLKKGLISFSESSTTTTHENSKVIAWIAGGLFVLVVGFLGYYTSTYALSDYFFQQSLAEASTRNGTATYKDQVKALTIFPYRSAYYRIFSQTNMALANSLAAATQKNTKPSDQQQSTMYQLIQQSINAGRQSTTLSPLTVANWQNLSSIYRALIGFGQNAENFAVLAAQQSETIDPTNPQEYVALGGIYYQLGQYDNAIRQFQIAASMKSDYANAYYNLGHAYEQKGDLQNALASYQAVQSLVANDKANSQVIAADIKAIQDKMGSNGSTTEQKQATTNKPVTTQPSQQQLNLPTQNTQLPVQATPVPLQGAVTPTPTH